MENNNRQGFRWDKNMDVRLKAWIERLLKESGILKHGLHPSVHESHNTFLVSIEETFHQEREKWLSESIEPCATSSERLDIKKVIDYIYEFAWHYGRYYHVGDSIKILECVKEVFQLPEEYFASQTPSPTGDRDCEELNENLQKRISELEEENNCLSEAVAAYKADFDKINIPTNNDWQKNIDRDSKPNNF